MYPLHPILTQNMDPRSLETVELLRASDFAALRARGYGAGHDEEILSMIRDLLIKTNDALWTNDSAWLKKCAGLSTLLAGLQKRGRTS